MVEGILLNIKGQRIELSLEEARTLRDALIATIGRKSYVSPMRDGGAMRSYSAPPPATLEMGRNPAEPAPNGRMEIWCETR